MKFETQRTLWRAICLLALLLAGCHAVPTAPDGNGSIRPLFTPGTELPAHAPGVPANTPMPTPTRPPPESTAIVYTVRAGDTLSGIAARYGTTVQELQRINGMSNADHLVVGRVLQITLVADLIGPAQMLLPDSEAVYGPGYAGFDVAAATRNTPGFFTTYVETVAGRELTAAEIVQQVAEQYSVGPRVLLALLELRGGWLSDPEPSSEAQQFPLGYTANPHWEGLYWQITLAASAVNAGVYGWWEDTLWLVQTDDGLYVQFSPDINAATAGVQRALAPGSADYAAWRAEVAQFALVYQRWFGDPFAYAVEPLLPFDLESPELVFPWPRGAQWYYTGGPHPGWGVNEAWAALDFVTGEQHLGCTTSRQWATAVAPGRVLVSRDGMVLQELDTDGFLGTGWVVLYLHVATEGRVAAGTQLVTGMRIGHPSCEGGVSSASHLHLARRYNGVWIAAHDSRWPLTLSGWTPVSTGRPYYGTLTQGEQVRTACECWEPEVNGLRH